MTARDAMRAAMGWLDEHPEVNPSSVYVDAAPAPGGATDGWHALLHVDGETLRAADGPVIRERFEGASLTCWSVEVAPGVHLAHVELDDDRRVPPTLPPEAA